MIHIGRFLKCIFDQYLIWLLNRKKKKKKRTKVLFEYRKKNLETFLSN